MDGIEVDRLRECKALGTLAGMTSGGVAFAAYFMGEIFDVSREVALPEFDIIAGALVIGMLFTFLGLAGWLGREIGQRIIYPIRVGDDRAGTKGIILLVFGGVAIVSVPYGILVIIQLLAQ